MPAWAHETGRLAADSSLSLNSTHESLAMTYRIHMTGQQAAAEWAELDANHDGLLSAEEKQAYLSAESRWLGAPIRVSADGQPMALGSPVFEVSGSPQQLELSQIWAWQRKAQNWSVRHEGVRFLSGKHHYHWQFDGPSKADFTVQEIPQISWQSAPPSGDPGGANAPPPGPPTAESAQDWDWNNSGGELDELLQGKSLLAALLIAFGLGAVHALTPGHGKTIVGAYLVGSRGTVPQAILLGIVVTVTHTFSVILLGLACLFLFQKYLPPTLIPWIGVASGFLMTLLGLTLLSGQVPSFIHHHHDDEDGHHHHHHHGHHHHHHHHHVPDKLSLGGLISLGVTGGMVPCPEALAVLLTALALNKLVLGLLILLAFSSGLAAVLVAIGIVMVSAAKLLEKRYPSKTMISRLSDLSYATMIVMGMVIAIRSYLNTL